MPWSFSNLRAVARRPSTTVATSRVMMGSFVFGYDGNERVSGRVDLPQEPRIGVERRSAPAIASRIGACNSLIAYRHGCDEQPSGPNGGHPARSVVLG